MVSWLVSRAAIKQKVGVVLGLYSILAIAGAGAPWMFSDAMTAQIVAGCGAVLGLVLIPYFSGIIGGPIAEVTQAMETTLSGGRADVSHYVDRDDCAGRLSRIMAQLSDNVSQASGRAVIADSSLGEQVLIVKHLGEALTRLAGGDVGCRIETAFPEAYDSLRRDFNAAAQQLQQMLSRVAGACDGIRTGSSEIGLASDDLARRTELQAANLAQTASAMDQITATMQETAKGAANVNHSVVAAHRDAEDGGKIVRQAVDAMDGIEKSSSEITQIISVIDGIAFQTNLLALNAGVEAARAGDAGKGFAVVANEVRALAQRSADAARDIKELITASSKQVHAGVQLVGQTGQALDRIVAKVAEISELAATISTAAETQSASLQEVNSVVGEMDKMTQQNAAMVEECNAAARSLGGEAEELTSLVGKFKLGHNDTRAAAPVRPTFAPARKMAPVRTPAAVRNGNLALAVNSADEDDWTDF